jgi:hypothetical protein
MAIARPAKLLPVKLYLGAALAPDASGRTYRYDATLKLNNPQIHSDIDGQYNLNDLKVGDYVNTNGAGMIMKIVDIDSTQSNTANITLEDEFRLNQVQDPSGNKFPYITSDNGVVFEVVEGQPILYPYSHQSASIVGFIKDHAAEIISRFNYLRQDTLATVIAPGPFIPGDLITWKNGSYRHLDGSDPFLGVVVENANPTPDSIRFKPNGSILDIALQGTGPFFYWDPNTPGKLTETEPAVPNRIIPAFFKLSDSQAILLEGAGDGVGDDSSRYVTLVGDQTIDGNKTFNGQTTFNDDIDLNGQLSITDTTQSINVDTGAVTIDGGLGVNKNVNIGEDLVVGGNFTVNGTATIVNSTNTSVTDKLLELNHGWDNLIPNNGDIGIVIDRGSEQNLFFGYDETEDVFTAGYGAFDGTSIGNLTLTDANARFADLSLTGGLDVSGPVTLNDTLNVVGQTTLSSLNVQDLTQGRVIIAGANGELVDDENLQWDGSLLTATGFKDPGLTQNRLLVAGPNGVIDDSPNLTIDGNGLLINDEVEITQNVTFSGGNINVQADFISDLLPDQNLTYNLGSTDKRWSNVYAQTLNANDLQVNTATIVDGIVFTTGRFDLENASNTAVEHVMYVLHGTTLSAAPQELFLDGNSVRIDLDNDTTMMFEIDAVGRETNGAGHCGFRIQGVVDKTGGVAILVNDTNETIVGETDEPWEVNVTTGSGTIQVVATGQLGKEVRWVAFVKTTKVSF